MESIQLNSSLAYTAVIRGTAREKMYQESELESLQHGRWHTELCYFLRLFKTQTPIYFLA